MRGDLTYAYGPVAVVPFQTKAANTAIKAGEPVIQGTAGDAEYVTAASADITTSDTFVGVAVTDDTVTSGADGVVYVWVPTSGTVYRGFAKSKAALASTVKLTKVILDLTSSVWTVDESTTTNGFCLIVDYNSTTGETYFIIDMTESVNA